MWREFENRKWRIENIKWKIGRPRADRPGKAVLSEAGKRKEKSKTAPLRRNL
jgi:hypothetical protein